MHNTQQPMPLEVNSSSIIVHEVWPTIQGEGPFAGRHAIFIRLAGCNLQCPFCDTDYTGGVKYENEIRLTTRPTGPTVDDMLDGLAKHAFIRNSHTIHQRQLVVITGGEPFRQNIVPLVNGLVERGYQVQIETNGTVFQPVHVRAIVVCSPKTPRISKDLAEFTHSFKYVLDADHVDAADGLPSGTMGNYGRPARPPEGFLGEVFVQPLDENDPAKLTRNLAACLASCLQFGYRLGIQTHKIVNAK